MDFAFTDEQRALHDEMRALGAAVAGARPEDRLSELARGGALGLCIDTAFGGGGHDLQTTAYAYEALGAAVPDGGVLLAAGAHLFGVALVVQQVGTDDQKSRWLPQLASGERIATVAATEPESGSNIGAAKALVAPQDDGFVVNGDKCYVTNAAAAHQFLFVGRPSASARGLTTVLLSKGAGVVVGEPLPTLGLRSAGLAPVEFRDCPADADDVLGRPGAGMAVFQAAMTYERALVLAFRLGAMQRALDEAALFARKRRLADRPIADHQAVSHRLARMKLRLETARLLLYRTAWSLDQGERAHAEAALTKWHLADAALESAADALLLRGGAGFLEPAGLGAELADALGGSIHSGTQDVLPLIVARAL
ncbi:MAG: acyl-CoA/acyl-ACP dehydrogenase [Deltaproteobacteria bacterium]|nr:acyl-CoA/acyl-ACP dehydrogenase [Deltaproteobacteria bacterium]MBW2536947.1 acyl-CoA/acyl-ACP dehydrogenase [Deltaproteobacteria bacterium]